jgi:hypothetical protein
MRKLWYVGLERYPDRYTWQLTDWVITRLKNRGIMHEVVNGILLNDATEIKTGQVLDAHGRCYWALTQIAELVRLLESGEITGEDVIFFEDLFHPGYEALPYILGQMPKHKRPKIFIRLLAQTIDPDDFTQKMIKWMRPFEHIVDNTVDGILMANTVMGPMTQVCMLNNAPQYITGLPFDKEEVRSRVNSIKPLHKRTQRIVFASRFDEEKQPWFLMDLIEKSKFTSLGYKFGILTGSKKLKSTNPKYVTRAYELQDKGLLTVHEGLTKNEYYELLADSICILNTSLQDFQSNTLNEACALGTLPLFPGFRSFPEALFNESRNLYAPWSIDDAIDKLHYLITTLDSSNDICNRVADEAHECIDKTIDICIGIGEKYRYKSIYD